MITRSAPRRGLAAVLLIGVSAAMSLGASARAHGPEEDVPRYDARTFYDTERNIIATAIEEGVARGIFGPVDPARVAAFVSTHIDGIFFSSLMRPDVDLAADMAQLKAVLWQILGHEGDR